MAGTRSMLAWRLESRLQLSLLQRICCILHVDRATGSLASELVARSSRDRLVADLIIICCEQPSALAEDLRTQLSPCIRQTIPASANISHVTLSPAAHHPDRACSPADAGPMVRQLLTVCYVAFLDQKARKKSQFLSRDI